MTRLCEEMSEEQEASVRSGASQEIWVTVMVEMETDTFTRFFTSSLLGVGNPQNMEFPNEQMAKNSPTWPKLPKMYQNYQNGHKEPIRPKYIIMVQMTQKRPKLV